MEDQGNELMRLAIIRPADRDAQRTRIPLDDPATLSDLSEEPDFYTASDALRAWAETDAIFDLANVVDVDPLERLRIALTNTEPSASSPEDLVHDIFGASATDVINKPEWKDNHSKVNDSVLAHKLTPINSRPRPLRRLADLLRAIVVVETVAERSDLPFDEAHDLISASLQLPAVFSRAQFMQQPAVAPDDRNGREKRVDDAKEKAAKITDGIKSDLDRLDKVERAVAELASLEPNSFQVTFKPDALNGPWNTIRLGNLPSTIKSGMSQPDASKDASNPNIETVSNMASASGPYSGLISLTSKLLNQWKKSVATVTGKATTDNAQERLMLTPDAIDGLSDETRELLEDLKIDPKTEPVDAILGRLRDELSRLKNEIEELLPRRTSRKISQIGGVVIDKPAQWIPGSGSLQFIKDQGSNSNVTANLIQGMMTDTGGKLTSNSLIGLNTIGTSIASMLLWKAHVQDLLAMIPEAFGTESAVVADTRGPSLLGSAGVQELFVIREHIVEYRPGEISHVENVLATELRERVHQRRRVSEQIFEREEEREIEEEHSLQTTEREELRRETESTMSENFEGKGSFEMTAKYGAVKNVTSGEFSMSNASEEASRFAAKSASEIIETARKKVASRIRTRQVSRILEELEETNTHTFDNTKEGAENVVGIYQWLDKVYRAEVWSYGLRTVYDLIIPEPAARLIAAAASTSATRGPSYMPLKPIEFDMDISGLDDQEVAKWVKKYGVTEEIDSYPTEKYIAESFQSQNDLGDSANKRYAEQKQIEIGEDYKAIEGWIVVQQYGEQHEAKIGVNVGKWTGTFVGNNIHGFDLYNKRGDLTNRTLMRPPIQISDDMGNSIGGKLSASVAADDISSLAVTITLHCNPTDEAIAKWQRKAFAAIRAAYDLRLQEWRDAQNAASFDQGDPLASLFGRKSISQSRTRSPGTPARGSVHHAKQTT